jgi:hypothetical protein
MIGFTTKCERPLVAIVAHLRRVSANALAPDKINIWAENLLRNVNEAHKYVLRLSTRALRCLLFLGLFILRSF